MKVNDPRAVFLYHRHYSSLKNKSSTRQWLNHGIAAPGEKIVLMTADSLALFVWIRQRYTQNGQHGVNCAVFRNETNTLSSELILEAEILARKKWPGEDRFYTYIDPKRVSSNPGYCFKKAGWKLLKDRGEIIKTTRGLLILEKYF